MLVCAKLRVRRAPSRLVRALWRPRRLGRRLRFGSFARLPDPIGGRGSSATRYASFAIVLARKGWRTWVPEGSLASPSSVRQPGGGR
eukprot:5645166-Alexandrium_andersonii.AAC.1